MTCQYTFCDHIFDLELPEEEPSIGTKWYNVVQNHYWNSHQKHFKNKSIEILENNDEWIVYREFMLSLHCSNGGDPTEFDIMKVKSTRWLKYLTRFTWRIERIRRNLSVPEGFYEDFGFEPISDLEALENSMYYDYLYIYLNNPIKALKCIRKAFEISFTQFGVTEIGKLKIMKTIMENDYSGVHDSEVDDGPILILLNEGINKSISNVANAMLQVFCYFNSNPRQIKRSLDIMFNDLGIISDE